MMKLLAVLLASAALVGAVEEFLKNYALLNNGDAYWISAFHDIPVPNRWVIKRPWGTAPRHCLLTAMDNNFCSPADLEVFDIYYADCHAPWVVCRCKNVGESYNINVIADNIGRVPVRSRSYVRHYSFYANQPPGGAYSTGNDVNVFGEWPVSTILFHETCHNLDYWVAGKGSGYYSRASQQQWKDAVAQDTCVPTDYAKSTWTEHFAEMCTQATYEENFGLIPVGTQCMSRSLTAARSLLRNAIKSVPGDLCIDRIAPSLSVCVSAAAREAGRCEGVPNADLSSKRKGEEAPVIEHYPY